MVAFYNEHDKYAAAWLRNLIAAGEIAPGVVDERSIVDVRPEELDQYAQCHFFAGIGVWSLALRKAGWPDDEPVWTGSCPCQPFSVAGKGEGVDDTRHLWPVFFRLIQACRPAIVLGEQVAGSAVIGKSALQGVQGRKAARGSVSQAQQRRSSLDLPNVRKLVGANDETLDVGNETRLPEIGAEHTTRDGSDLRRASPGDGERDGFRVEMESHSVSDRRGVLRSDGTGVRPDRHPSLERSVAGSNQSPSGLHASEHPSGAVRSEYDGGHLGIEPSTRSGRSDQAESGVNDPSRSDHRTVDAKDEPVWLDAVLADLEDAHYTCGAVVVPACGLGAPNIRQRLWWFGERLGHAESAGRRERPVNVFGEATAGEGTLARQGHGYAARAAGADGGLVDADRSGARAQPGDHREAGEEAVRDLRADDRPALLGGAGPVGGVALANDAEWRTDLSRRDERDRRDPGWTESAGHVGPRGATGGMADADIVEQSERGPGRVPPKEKPGSNWMHDSNGVAGERGLGWVAEPDSTGLLAGRRDDPAAGHGHPAAPARDHGGLADADGGDAGSERQQRGREQRQQPQDGLPVGVADASASGRREERPDGSGLGAGDGAERLSAGSVAGGFDLRPGPTNGFWRDADWLFCRDAKWRAVESQSFPLVDGYSGRVGLGGADWSAPAGKEGFAHRVGRLRGYGNAINAHAAIAFIEAFLEARHPERFIDGAAVEERVRLIPRNVFD